MDLTDIMELPAPGRKGIYKRWVRLQSDTREWPISVVPCQSKSVRKASSQEERKVQCPRYLGTLDRYRVMRLEVEQCAREVRIRGTYLVSKAVTVI